MKTATRLSLLALALGLVVPLWGQTEKTLPVKRWDPHPYYPLKVGNKWIYQAGSQQVVIDVEKVQLIKLDIKNDKGTMVPHNVETFVLKMTSGDKVMTEQVGLLGPGTYRFQPNIKPLEISGGVYRFQVAGKDLDPPACFLKLPLKSGDSWTVDSKSEGTVIKGEYVAGDETVKVPAGSFPAFTVKSKDLQIGAQPMEVAYWFAPEVGMVKQTVKVGDFQTMLELLKFEPK